MTAERPTIRPVTLARLAETAHACQLAPQTTATVEEVLDVTHRRARETILEACRIGLIEESMDGDEAAYLPTTDGRRFVAAIEEERWSGVSEILAELSAHYAAFLDALAVTQPASLKVVLEALVDAEANTDRTYNSTSVEVLGDWAERLGVAQRNAFNGEYYLVERAEVPQAFSEALLAVYDDLEDVAGIALRQRYISIPELREGFCSVYRCPRAPFDEAIQILAAANIGKLELSGAPLDTSAKDAALGIKSIRRADEGGLVSTSQSNERIMAGVEQHGKRYYFLAVFDRDLTFPEETST